MIVTYPVVFKVKLKLGNIYGDGFQEDIEFENMESSNFIMFA